MPLAKNPDICAAVKEVYHNPLHRGVCAKTLAERLGYRNEFPLYALSDAKSTQYLPVETLIALFLASGRDPRVLDVVAEKCGGVFTDVEGVETAGEGLLGKVLEEVGRFCQVAAKSLKDNRITPIEEEAMRLGGKKAISAIVAFLKRNQRTG